MAGYTTLGKVCGCCGHTHRQIKTAVKCMQKQNNQMARMGGRSDRKVIKMSGKPLNKLEQALVEYVAAK